MTVITKIVFPIPNDNLGDTTADDCDVYRSWFADQLSAEYPNAAVTVSARPGSIEVETDDDSDDVELIESLRDFGNRRWEQCPWDWQ